MQVDDHPPDGPSPPQSEAPDGDRRRSLPAVLSLFDAVAIVVGSIIGSGVFMKASVVARELESFGPIVLTWAGIGIVTLCGSLALAELAAMMPHAGGPYVYLREAYGRLPAFLWGWTEFWIIRTGSLGALATATIIYLDQVVPIPEAVEGLTAVGLILLLTLVNWRSTRWGANVQSFTTVVKLGFLAVLISLPFWLGKADTANLAPIWPEATGFDFWRSVGMAAIAVMWAYDGWINIAPVAEDIRNPQRNIPLALTFGMIIIVLTYIGANTAYHLVLSMDQVASSDAVASDTFYVLLGRVGIPLAALGVMCSTFGATQSSMLVGPRIYFAMARDDLLPRRLSNVHVVYATPGNAVLLQGAWACLLVFAAYAGTENPAAAFDILTNFVIFGGSVFYAMAVASVFVLRFKRPDWPRPYRTLGYPWTPSIYLLAFVAVLASLLVDNWQPSLAGGGLIAAGAVYYAWRLRRVV
jgi:basic amino acid/polyamine antiporter, APA family